MSLHETSTSLSSLRLPRMRYRRSHRGPWLQFWHPKGFEWNVVDLEIFDLPEALIGLRILHITDLHTRAYWSPDYDLLHERVQNDPPDFIMMTGDFVDNRYDPGPALPTLEKLLAGLRAKQAIYGVRGNHDAHLFGPPLETSQVQLVEGKQFNVRVNDAEFELIGLPGIHRKNLTEEMLRDVPKRQPGKPRIVMAHYPDQIMHLGHWQADLYLAGHTHGGQIWTPMGFASSRHDSLPYRFHHGIHRLNRTWMCVGRGLGFSSWPVRIFCPAEVIEIRLTRELKD